MASEIKNPSNLNELCEATDLPKISFNNEGGEEISVLKPGIPDVLSDGRKHRRVPNVKKVLGLNKSNAVQITFYDRAHEGNITIHFTKHILPLILDSIHRMVIKLFNPNLYQRRGDSAGIERNINTTRFDNSSFPPHLVEFTEHFQDLSESDIGIISPPSPNETVTTQFKNFCKRYEEMCTNLLPLSCLGKDVDDFTHPLDKYEGDSVNLSNVFLHLYNMIANTDSTTLEECTDRFALKFVGDVIVDIVKSLKAVETRNNSWSSSIDMYAYLGRPEIIVARFKKMCSSTSGIDIFRGLFCEESKSLYYDYKGLSYVLAEVSAVTGGGYRGKARSLDKDELQYLNPNFVNPRASVSISEIEDGIKIDWDTQTDSSDTTADSSDTTTESIDTTTESSNTTLVIPHDTTYGKFRENLEKFRIVSDRCFVDIPSTIKSFDSWNKLKESLKYPIVRSFALRSNWGDDFS